MYTFIFSYYYTMYLQVLGVTLNELPSLSIDGVQDLTLCCRQKRDLKAGEAIHPVLMYPGRPG